MLDISSWSQIPAVYVGGRYVINHAGAKGLQPLADRTGLTCGLSRALVRRGFVPLSLSKPGAGGAAVLIAQRWGYCRFDHRADQADRYGSTASMRRCGGLCTTSTSSAHKIARVRATTRKHGWSLIPSGTARSRLCGC